MHDSISGRAQPPSSCCEILGSPLGFFDPAGFSKEASEGRIKFYREVEIKHGRVAMLAALGFPIAEIYHPLFGGDIDVPSYVAFQETPLQVVTQDPQQLATTLWWEHSPRTKVRAACVRHFGH